MPPPPLPSGRPRAPSPLGREILRAAIAGCGLVAIFAIALTMGTGWQMPSLRKLVFADSRPSQGDDDLTTGSIVFMPIIGDKCRQNEIDNATWQVREIGTVPCKQALARKSHGQLVSGPLTRIDIIRESFRRGLPPRP